MNKNMADIWVHIGQGEWNEIQNELDSLRKTVQAYKDKDDVLYVYEYIGISGRVMYHHGKQKDYIDSLLSEIKTLKKVCYNKNEEIKELQEKIDEISKEQTKPMTLMQHLKKWYKG